MISLERAKVLTAAFSQQHIVVIGDVVLDRYIYGRVERLNPEAPVPILHAREERQATGGAGNTAKNAAMLGARTTLVSVVGDDDMATVLEEQAGAEGYQAVLVRDEERPTIEKTRFLVGSQQMLRVDYEEVQDISKAIEEQVIASFGQAAQGGTGVLVSDYAKGVITERIAHEVLATARSQQLPVMADVKPVHINYFTGVTYISPNKKEAHEYLGLNALENQRDPATLAAMLFETFETTVFLTLSGDGMYVFAGVDNHQQVPTPYVREDEVVDPSGCGDTAAVTLLLARLAGATEIEAAALANAAGATVARKVGSVGLTVDELLDTVTHHHGT